VRRVVAVVRLPAHDLAAVEVEVSKNEITANLNE
jgi:hypothetical protein